MSIVRTDKWSVESSSNESLSFGFNVCFKFGVVVTDYCTGGFTSLLVIEGEPLNGDGDFSLIVHIVH